VATSKGTFVDKPKGKPMATDVTSCSLIEVSRRLRVKCCFHHQGTLRLNGLKSQTT